MNTAMKMHHPSHPTPAGTFSDRIKLLIQHVGSATEIARMCGFSEGVVRSWRDGNTDPSRGRCVTLARTLGISLVWLVAGEGGIQIDPAISIPDEQHTTEMVPAPRSRARSHPSLTSTSQRQDATVDAQRLDTAMKILLSQLELAGGHLTLAGNSDMLAELYAILGPGGVNVDTDAMVDFNHRLAQRIRQGRHTA